MAIYPGATFRPTSFGGKVQRNRQGRGMLHVAVSNAKSLPPSSGTTWHFYIAKTAPDGSTDGSGGPAYCEQYVDTEYRAYGGADGNDDQLIVETAGGTGTSRELNAERWTRAQELRIADLMRWEASQPGGAPLELLPDARPGRRGWGPHRLGIKHSQGLVPGWWFPGCELWSNSLGKECPGDAKIAQIPAVVALARQSPGQPVQEDTMSMAIVVAPDKTCWIILDDEVRWTASIAEVSALAKPRRLPIVPMEHAEIQQNIDAASRYRARRDAATAAAVAKALPVPDVDEAALAETLAEKLAPKIAEAVPLSADAFQAMLDDSEIDTVRLMAERLAGSQG